MQYTSKYNSPLGEVLISADDEGLTGVWLVGQEYFDLYLDEETEEKEIDIIKGAKRWLDMYFSGEEPDIKIPLHFKGTDFQNEVWQILCTIPYGKTMTYGDIAHI